MLFNKIAAAVLVVGISAMAIGKISTILLPHGSAGAHDTAGAGPVTPPPDPDPGWPAAMADADVKAGKRQAGKCLSCHTLNKGGPNRVGPNLYGVAGRKIGSHGGFGYSSAMKGKGGTWTLQALYKFLADPSKTVPGTKMAYRMSKWKQRRDLVAYLASLGDKPVPLPDVPKPKKADPKKADPKKGDKAPGRKTEKMPARKAAPAKPAEPKKAAPEKPAEPKKAAVTAKPAEPKKAEPKKAAPAKPAEPKKAAVTAKPAAPKKAMPTDGKADGAKTDGAKKDPPAATPGDGEKKANPDDKKDGN